LPPNPKVDTTTVTFVITSRSARSAEATLDREN
jgi:hypothetical protein